MLISAYLVKNLFLMHKRKKAKMRGGSLRKMKKRKTDSRRKGFQKKAGCCYKKLLSVILSLVNNLP